MAAPNKKSTSSLLTTLLLAAAGADAAQLVRAPYLQLVTPNSVLIAWQTVEPADSRVEFSVDDSYAASVTAAELTTNHVLQLEGLAAATRYFYRVWSGGTLLWEGKSFSRPIILWLLTSKAPRFACKPSIVSAR